MTVKHFAGKGVPVGLQDPVDEAEKGSGKSFAAGARLWYHGLVMGKKYLYSNLHVHTPHSFSYFSSMEEIAEQAEAEDISILGVSDFDTWEGFGDFAAACEKHSIFPCFGMEVMALSRTDQDNGRLVNDPKNPGRAYLCGKGLPRNPSPGKFALALRERVKRGSLKRMGEILRLLNGFLESADVHFRLSLEDIAKTTASGWIRERHIARALAENILNSDDPEGVKTALGLSAAPGDSAALQESVRANLLKAGGAAYAPEDEGAFPSPGEARRLFLSLGGIPAYPVLADGAGEITDWEKTPGELCRMLNSLGYSAVEFIPHRNSAEVLLEYAETLHEEGFAVTAGSEHNSPSLLPLKPVSRDSNRLPGRLLEIFALGAFCVAGHRGRLEKGLPGLVDAGGARTGASVEELAGEGEKIIRRFLNE